MKILWIPHTGWHIPQRAHLFCRALSQHHQVHVTDWVADFASIKDYMSRRYLRNFRYRQYTDGDVTVHGIPRISPAIFFPQLRQFNTRLFVKHLNRIIHQYQIDVVVGSFLTPPPEAAPALVLDVFDDNVALWESYGRVKAYGAEILANEMAYIKKADAVVVVSSVLRDKIAQHNPPGHIHHIPNGVNIAQYDAVAGTPRSYPITGKLVGAVGNHDKSIELDKIIDAAKALADEDITLLIAGRGSAVPAAQERVQREGITNVIFQGFIPPDEVATVITQLDVGLCPYMKTIGADSQSPMRLLLYTAAGLPTVCTNLEEVQRMQFPNVVLVNDDSQSLVAGIRQALTLPRSRPPHIDAYEIGHLVNQYEAVLRAAVESKSTA